MAFVLIVAAIELAGISLIVGLLWFCLRWFASRTDDDHVVEHRIMWGQWARKHHVRLTLLAVALLPALWCLIAFAWLYLTIGTQWPGD